MPLNAEALLDPKNFRVSQAAGGAQDKGASEIIRDAAVRVDGARSKLRKADPERALETWQGLVRGRWSLVDWFDTDGRRFVLAKPNAPNIGDPRGLTEREAQVAMYAAAGDSGRIIAYRFGLSTSSVSRVLKSAMRKLGVSTQAQLVEKMRGFPPASADSSPD
jgi:DNA-binding NarL/FixJ family response regulator